MCYAMRVASSSRPFIGPEEILVAHQLGTATRERHRSKELCVP
jgi:hypothetical protein